MAVLLDRFKQIHGDGTKQIGRNFCIPASLCNAVRLCGVTGCTQERVRDAWYAESGKAIEPNLDDQMDGAGFGIFETMERRIEGMDCIDNEFFNRPGDNDPVDLRRADLALDFIERHINAAHPVIVSTWNRIYNGDIIEIQGYHMWLVLDFDRAANVAVFHDSGPDQIRQTTITSLQPIKLKGQEYQLDMGLRGCITHSDYSCLALWKEPA
jgi:hypothetical protein